MRAVCRAVLLAMVSVGMAQGADKSRFMLDLNIKGRHIEGMPLAWSSTNVYLLSRDGRLWDFDPDQAREFRKVDTAFRSYSSAELRQQVFAELGKRFEVSGTGHYLVAHPAGQRDLWADRFEDLYRSFMHYFAVRGFHLTSPEFPLVAIVFPNKTEFLRYAGSETKQLPPNVLGYYSPVTNRIALFDITAGQSAGQPWHVNAETIIHEATHQTAFNTGIHSRFAPQPRWVVEGLATTFEAPGVWDSRAHPRQADRINRSQREAFRQYLARGRKADSLVQLVSSDRVFQVATQNAYAEAWALSFFLIETQPRDYARYLKHLAALPAFDQRTAAERVADFTGVFGGNFRLLEARFLRFINELH